MTTLGEILSLLEALGNFWGNSWAALKLGGFKGGFERGGNLNNWGRARTGCVFFVASNPCENLKVYIEFNKKYSCTKSAKFIFATSARTTPLLRFPHPPSQIRKIPTPPPPPPKTRNFTGMEVFLQKERNFSRRP